MKFRRGSPLSSEELWLLQPVSIEENKLRFKSLRVDRTRAPRYTAISYAWGNEGASEYIYVDGEAKAVSSNLWSCLYHIGSSTYATGSWGYIWVDAICLDQENKSELNVQVSRMDQTYKDAVCVSVWLGLPSPGMGKFSWFKSITDLANRPYWTRRWVVQEFLLGRDVNLHCGSNQIDWQDFKPYITGADAAVPILWDRDDFKLPNFSQPLCDLLLTHHAAECRDPPDRVFALLGLVTEYERGLLGRFFPDYTMSADHVFILTIAHMICMGATFSYDSDEIVFGLGVKSKSRRKMLFHRAKQIDYLDNSCLEAMMRRLASQDETRGSRSGHGRKFDKVDRKGLNFGGETDHTSKTWESPELSDERYGAAVSATADPMPIYGIPLAGLDNTTNDAMSTYAHASDPTQLSSSTYMSDSLYAPAGLETGYVAQPLDVGRVTVAPQGEECHDYGIVEDGKLKHRRRSKRK